MVRSTCLALTLLLRPPLFPPAPRIEHTWFTHICPSHDGPIPAAPKRWAGVKDLLTGACPARFASGGPCPQYSLRSLSRARSCFSGDRVSGESVGPACCAPFAAHHGPFAVSQGERRRAASSECGVGTSPHSTRPSLLSKHGFGLYLSALSSCRFISAGARPRDDHM